MSFLSKPEPEPTPRDWEGVVLTENQVYMISDYLDRIIRGVFTQEYLTELRFLAHRTFHRAVNAGDREKMSEIGPELQVIDHVLKVAFDGTRPKRNLAPDPKHLAYLKYLDDQAMERLLATEQSAEQEEGQELDEEEMALEEEVAEDVADIVEESSSSLEGLSADVIAAFHPKSSVPEIAKIQKKLESLVNDYRYAVEDAEPPFIQKRILATIATTHEQLESLLNS